MTAMGFIKLHLDIIRAKHTIVRFARTLQRFVFVGDMVFVDVNVLLFYFNLDVFM